MGNKTLKPFTYVNDPAVICKLLRAIATGDTAKANGHDIILEEAAKMIERGFKQSGH